MDFALRPHLRAHRSAVGWGPVERESCARSPHLVLPLVSRSVSLLTALLQDAAVDLELASSVVGLDPGLTFGALQVANCDRSERNGLIWQLPLAVVAAGREALERFIHAAPTIESCDNASRRHQMHNLVGDAVARASMAHFLSRELGACNPRKSFLAGLLFELPALVRLAATAVGPSQAALLSAMCHILPAAVVKAVMARAAGNEKNPDARLQATVLIADAVLQAQAGSYWPSHWAEELASGPLWHCWNETDPRQRAALLDRCDEIARWATANLYRLDPWEFMARLERRKPLE